MLIKADVRFGSKADICNAKRHVRFTPKSGHVQCTGSCLLCANSGHAGGGAVHSINGGHRTGSAFGSPPIGEQRLVIIRALPQSDIYGLNRLVSAKTSAHGRIRDNGRLRAWAIRSTIDRFSPKLSSAVQRTRLHLFRRPDETLRHNS